MNSFVTNIEPFKEHFKVIANLGYNHVKPVKDGVENGIIIPLVGLATYNRVFNRRTVIVDPENPELDYERPEDAELIERIERAVVWCTIRDGLDLLNVEIGSGGVTVNVSDNSVAASSARVENLRRNVETQSYKLLDQLVEWLETHINVFTDYATHPDYLEANKHIIRNAKQFNEFVNIQENRFVFLKMLPIMRRVMRRNIETATCRPFITAVLANEALAEPDVKYETPVELLKSAIANLTFSDSLDFLAIQVGNQGITMFSNPESATANNKAAATMAARKQLIMEHSKRGMDDLEELITYLKSNADSFEELSECEKFQSTEASADYSIKTVQGGSIAL